MQRFSHGVRWEISRRGGRSQQVFMENQSMVLILSLVMGLLVNDVAGDVLAVSKLTKCVTSKQDQSDLKCQNKTVVALTVVANSKGDSDQMEVFVPAASDEKGLERKLLQPYRIVIKKSKVRYNYPLEYKQNFNAKPNEVVFSIVGCKAGDGDEQVSCTWAHNPKDPNVRIADSQGFCCKCHGLFGRDSHKRFTVKCPFNVGSKKNGSAHCLRWSPEWYSAYSIQEYKIDFTISMTIQMMLANNFNGNVEPTSTVLEEIHVSPRQLFALSSSRSFSMKLQGDLADYRPAPVIYEKYLNIPREDTGGQPKNDLFGWMLIDKNKYTEDGRECDKIGVSYTAFRYQTDGCDRRSQTCLANQLADFKNEDMQRRKDGLRPFYSVVQYGNAIYDSEALKVQAPDTMTSVITVEMAADNIRFLTNRSPGKIQKAEVKSFEALSRNGVLTVELRNIGEISADFYLFFTNCSQGINPPNGQTVNLPVPAVNTTLEFQLHTADDKALSRYCSVFLYDAAGGLCDNVTVVFASTTTVYDNKSQNFVGDPIEHKNNTDDGSWQFPFSLPNLPAAHPATVPSI
ncbi:hypothetical protein R1sor_024868 [Riccia sorocarpa]|uniref:Generative cell specific-1/HAP2 domain-containing protein n=1 Tax=Riccia sorocarpa TaxID=122646 RepID=A0ABD3GTZ5_9MARC